MKVTIYTTSTCPFSKQEKEYLQSRNVVFEEKSVEENRDFLNELLTVSNNFAGTPVTKVEKDDGQSVVLKGFTREEFDAVLGPDVMAAQQQPSEPTTPTSQPPTMEPPTTNTPPPPQPMPEPEPEPTPPPVTPEPQPEPPVQQTPSPQPETPPVVEPPKPEPVKQAEPNDALDAILKDLQSKVNETYSTQGQDQPTPKPVDLPEKPEDKPAETPPAPTPQPPTPQPATPPAPSAPPIVPDFPK